MDIDIRLSEFISRVTGRAESLFAKDIQENEGHLRAEIEGKSAVVIGGAGTIGSSFVKQMLRFRPKRVFVIDTNENELTELTRDLRSTPNLAIPDEFVTLPMDFADSIALRLLRSEGPFQICANFAALKHVRSEKNEYCSAYMIKNNVLKAHQLLETVSQWPPEHFFCVSTDKAAAPVNLMGASKKLMEELALSYAARLKIATARFANVAFSNGSLLDGFLKRLHKRQPLAAPSDVKRYFVSPEESGQLCLMACILGESGDIFVPRLDPERDTRTFSKVAQMLLDHFGLKAVVCESEEEARQFKLHGDKEHYPCFFFHSDTTGEKPLEQFWTVDELVDRKRFDGVDVVRYANSVDSRDIARTIVRLEALFSRSSFTKNDIVHILHQHLSNFAHQETNRYLDQRM